MSEKQSFDFERQWLNKFSNGLDEEIRSQVMEGSEYFTDQSENSEVIAWSQQAMIKLEELVPDEDKCIDVITGCACHYSKEKLQPVREKFEETGQIDTALEILQDQFEDLLRNNLLLSEDMISDIVSKGWGSAGVLQGNRIIATKIPKSGYLHAYMEESDPAKKRAYYCHCPRVRNALNNNETLPEIYCYCGGGFYQGIWEEILQQPVRIKLLKSVMNGNDVCQFEILLPEGLV
ncbi:MAG: hypothetical protein JEZ06_00820 [Anaerolineaceae bacterium]|nr:hypothetical protein [Anaerolineaceae bacterium]